MKYIVILTALITLAVVPCSAEIRRPDKEKYSEVKISAMVVAIDHDIREVTLASPMGNLVTFTAGPEIKRLHEVEVGDMVKAVYTTWTRAEFRDPTEDEKANPLEIIAEGHVGGSSEDPNAIEGTIVKAVVTLVLVNKDMGLVTIQGPLGNFMSLPVEDKALLNDLKTGGVAVLTYAEAIGIALDKVNTKENK
jgi:hypothetical protein